jgi:hypothetical protein
MISNDQKDEEKDKIEIFAIFAILIFDRGEVKDSHHR